MGWGGGQLGMGAGVGVWGGGEGRGWVVWGCMVGAVGFGGGGLKFLESG